MFGLTIAAIAVAIGCAAACVARLLYVTTATTFHPGVWLARIRAGKGGVVLEAVQATPTATWERALAAAVAEPNEEARAGLVNEQLSELDFRIARWQRVPRVCASIASSAGFLLGSLVLRFGLTAAANASDELRGATIDEVVVQAVNVAVFGVAGASFAIAAHYRARRLSAAFLRDVDSLVEVLEKQER